MIRHFGVIGYPLGHSFSPDYFAKKFKRENLTEYTYTAFPLTDIQELSEVIKKKHLSGINVTIPFKEKVIPILSEIDDSAKKVGAVNCIKITGDKLIGYNTDVWGFTQSLLPLLPEIENVHPKALILGTGGASKAVAESFRLLQIEFATVSRGSQGDFYYADLNKNIIQSYDIIVNTTPLGMSPDIGSCPDIPYEYLKKTHFLIDLIYNPKKTVFLTKGLQHHCTIKNGSDMLVYQAEKSWEIWNQK
ncbi:MAG: shikimate dehydrogenase [Saprospiraceae bacterium]|nr:shikimate dehydrogenase [Saprospiraceae bacterium]